MAVAGQLYIADTVLSYLINVAMPSDRNVVQKEAEKKLKYKNLSIKIQ
jgi:hypothetical protein